MANKEDFTPEEWKKVLDSIAAAGVAIAASHPSGWWGTLKEAAAGTPAIIREDDAPNSNPLIRTAIADFGKTGDGNIVTLQERFSRGKPAENVERSLKVLREVTAILDKNAPDDAPAFKAWLYEVSEKVAEAAIEGSVMGFGGVRVSDAEKATLKEIATALGLEG